MAERLYLDSCVLNRPGDDQRQPRVRAESAAIAKILDIAVAGGVHWIASSVVELELKRNPRRERREDALLLLSLTSEFVHPTPASFQRAIALRAEGYGDFDALHLAVAELTKVDCLLTVDDRFLRRAGRRPNSPVPRVENPINWGRRRSPWLLNP
ncbi:type II toxin-antitoxin system VapC family toxin [Granulicella rosea]|uniref:type II toxin-antitoxin system VapC family toxin n=1 Tax=Granulicella rosea TaxID=474952 RepID=UPI000B797D98|nr:PIN domain-containing protein [Granulicella rosea]